MEWIFWTEWALWVAVFVAGFLGGWLFGIAREENKRMRRGHESRGLEG